MVTLSNFVMVGIIEAFMLLIVGLVFVAFLYRRAQNRNRLLSTQLKQLKETTIFLLEKVNDTSKPNVIAEPEQKVVLKAPVASIKQDSKNYKDMITKLLAEKDEALSEVSIKVDELNKLNNFLAESDVCMKLLEDQIQCLSIEASDQKIQLEEKNDLIHDFTRESMERLACIEALEDDNKQLRDQLSAMS